MCRPIKFRGWNDVEKKMYSPTELFNLQGFWWEDTPEGELQGSLVTDSYGTRRHFTLMQYVGVNTWNGDEIFEGDIVENGSGRKFIVEWAYLSFEFRELERQENGTLYKDRVVSYIGDLSATCRIVGNVFETPTLLV